MNITRCFKKLLFTGGVIVLGAGLAQAQNAPTNLFQINGDASNDNLTCDYGPCDYWNLLNGSGAGTSPGAAGSSTVRTFISGSSSTDSFTGGGSKDPNDLSQWAYSNSPTPNKDTLNAVYAAAYSAPNGDFELMFGADRASPSGDANIGIWFFQQNITTNGKGGFTGLHTTHDIFIISSFTGGGGTSNVSVLEWDPGCATGVKNPTSGQCADTNLRLLGSAAGSSVCGSSPFCAITNSSTTTTTWEGQLASPLFFQGGVDITQVLATAGITSLPCFSSFLTETRSSQSTTAVLKDFLLGGFPVCGLAITKQCDSANQMLVNNGTQVQFAWKGTVTNTGVGTLSSIQVNDALPNNTTANPTVKDASGNTITSLPAKQTGYYSITYLSSNLTETNNATAQGSFGTLVFSTDPAHPATATCTQTVNTALTVAKSCVAPGPGLNCTPSGCVVQVPVRAKVCNTGNVQITGITLTDSPTTTVSPNGFTLSPNQCTGDTGAPALPTGTYTPTAAAGDGATNGRYTFTDTISITAARPTLGTLTPIGTGQLCSGTYGCAQASCPLCNGGECTTTALQ